MSSRSPLLIAALVVVGLLAVVGFGSVLRLASKAESRVARRPATSRTEPTINPQTEPLPPAGQAAEPQWVQFGGTEGNASYDVTSVRRSGDLVYFNQMEVFDTSNIFQGPGPENEQRMSQGLPMIDSAITVVRFNCKARTVAFLEREILVNGQKSRVPLSFSKVVRPNSPGERLLGHLCSSSS